MFKSKRSRILVIVALFAVGVLFGVTMHSPTNAVAASNVTYYNNAAHTMVVGQFGHDCCNNPVAWGKKSKYPVYGGCFPCVPPPR